MSEPIWTTVRFKVPTTWNPPGLPPWFVAYTGDYVLSNGDTFDEDADGAGWTIWGVQGEANYGLADPELEMVLNWCERQRVPYYASDETKYDMQATIDYFDGTEHRRGDGDQEGAPVLTLYHWRNLSDGIDPEAAVAAVAAYFDSLTVPPLEEVDIDHLPVQCPPEQNLDPEPWVPGH